MTNRTKERKLKSNPDAVATQLGWVNPKTGELLVSIRGLSGAKMWDRKTNTFAGAPEPVKAAPQKPDVPVVEIADVPAPKATKKPTKRATKKATVAE